MIRVRPQESPQKGAEMELAAACTLIVHNFLESLVSYAIPCEGRKWSKLPWRGSTFLLTLLISQHSRRGSSSQKVLGHTVNVVKGLKLYEGIFTDSELHNLVQYINALRHAGTRGELSGETFIFFNKQMKGNKREIIQFGIPLFQPTTEEAARIVVQESTTSCMLAVLTTVPVVKHHSTNPQLSSILVAAGQLFMRVYPEP
ncbi:uncharacterized protein LOC122051275 isoform X2 [Zingiber officinale]|uniref:uncharacterized protein LOC122051275 isoform X2 n=1 Tax=Zingiber officinale TaxID=94328 RepID=UPI001C4CA44E|nr:uncharacterized protein LOC122051275 isoform X2 [Zingiber officinale]